jgi:hypothetical protein
MIEGLISSELGHFATVVFTRLRNPECGACVVAAEDMRSPKEIPLLSSGAAGWRSGW